MTTTFEPGSGTMRKAKKLMFEGTKNEKIVIVGQQMVKADARFVSTEVTPFGPCDAQRERAIAAGEPAPRPFWDVVAKTKERVAALIRKNAEKRKLGEDGTQQQPQVIVQMPAGSVPAGKPAAGSPEELAAQLALFEDDPEMQDVVLLKWQQKRNALKGLAPVAGEAPSAAARPDLPSPHEEAPAAPSTPMDEPPVGTVVAEPEEPLVSQGRGRN